MQIVVYETEHFETAYALVRLLDLPSNHITIYTNAATATRLYELFDGLASGYTWIIQQDNEPNRVFIRKMYADFDVNKPDLLLYGTVSNNYLLHAILLKKADIHRTILTVHEVNAMFHYPLKPGLRNVATWLGTRLLMKRVKELNVIVETIIPYLKKQLQNDKVIHHLPGGIFENAATRASFTLPVKLVVPGTIERSRRDYRQVFQLLEIAEQHRMPINIVLLGTPAGNYGARILARAKAWNGEHTHLKFYREIVPQPEFDKQLRDAHFVFMPTMIEHISGAGIKEVYGETKSSGNIFDIVRHAKPAIVPGKLLVPSTLEGCCKRYDSVQEIAAYLQYLQIHPDKYDAIQQEALSACAFYTIENIRKRNSASGLFG